MISGSWSENYHTSRWVGIRKRKL